MSWMTYMIPLINTPTPIPDYVKVPMNAPTGWVMAGILIIILILMLYQTLKRFVLGLVRKTQSRG